MSASPYFPLFLRLAGMRVLIVGGGAVAARKLALLKDLGARVEIVARSLDPDVQAEVDAGRAVHLGPQFDPTMLAGCRLAIAATDDAALNRAVAEAAGALNLPVNVVDDAE